MRIWIQLQKICYTLPHEDFYGVEKDNQKIAEKLKTMELVQIY